ncbi:TetR/AcrR family transcriptional regulator [Rathayibacter soli]|uniref:TetR/AcrR family transcriptional regulator n=1 Tax=Rathayibacter soli TaxID=3144168 RepID=UPI0027E4AD2A|nr:TetR/AcrR family transcriptional regulator [Glaciibacter superstes]
MAISDLIPGAGAGTGNDADTVTHVRTAPVQARSVERINALLDAAAAVIDEIGIHRLTTDMVAERAATSIGTVYRYFPDRVALLHGLRDRATARFHALVLELIRTQNLESVLDAGDCALEAYIRMYRREPGFRIIRFTDPTRHPGEEEAQDPSEFFASRFAQILTEKFGLPSTAGLALRLQIAVRIGDALTAQAFQKASGGDERILTEAHVAVRTYLAADLAQGIVSHIK